MESNNWIYFIDNFIHSINRIIPFESFFSYQIKNINHRNISCYHGKNLNENSIQEYLSKMYNHDPISFKNSDISNSNILLLRQQNIPDQYHSFLVENQVYDNIEIIFNNPNSSILAISLIRNSNEGLFSDQEISIIESFYLLANFNMQSDYNKPNYNEIDFNFESFTNKERKVLSLILQGKKNQDIADELFVSITTIKTHIQHILRKSQVNSKQELIYKYLSYK